MTRMADPRERNIRHLATAVGEPRALEWAGPKLEEAFAYGPAPLCISGAFNSAKTVTVCLKLLYLMDRYPGFRVLIARRVWDELKKTTMPSFFKFCPRQAWEPHGRRADQEKILRLNNGSEVIWMHLEDPDSLSILRGLEINAFFFDQAEEIEEETFTTALTRLGRWDQAQVPEAVRVQEEMALGQPWPWIEEHTRKAIPPTYALLTCNPDHELHWLWRRFHPDSSEWQNTYRAQGYRMIEVSTYDNKYATRQNIVQMEAQDETWKRRFLYGQWGIPEGQIHQVTAASIIEPTPVVLHHVMQRCTLHRAMDHGDSAPTCVLWYGVDGDGNIFVYREYYMPNQLISRHRESVAALSKYERYVFQLADPSIFGPSMQKHNQRWSVAEEWADCVHFPRETAVFWDKGDNDELGTRNRISEYLKPQGLWRYDDKGELVEVPRIHPITKEKGKWPRIYFVRKTLDYPNGCDQVIRQTRSARRMKLGTDNGRAIFSDERDSKLPDHAYDPLRYAMASQPPLPHSVPKKYAENSFFGRRDMAIRMKKRGDFAKMAKQAKRQYSRMF